MAEISGTDGNDSLSAGNDEFNYLKGFEGDDTLVGGPLYDQLYGGEGNDSLAAGGGDDAVTGQAGNDTLDGGSGIDQVFYGYYAAAGGPVTVDLRAGTAKKSGPYGKGTDKLLNFEDISATDFNDSLAGNDLTNRFTGGNGNDTILGRGGDDQIWAGGGSDLMIGGTGNDQYDVDDSGDRIVEAVGGGDLDFVISDVNFTMPDNVEVLLLGGFPTDGKYPSLNGDGNGEDNDIRGNDGNNRLNGLAGDDFLNGSGGNDTLDGGIGADNMSGDIGNDLYYVDSLNDFVIETWNAGIDEVVSSIDFALGSDVENLTLADSGVSGTGNELANIIVGNGAANLLDGGGGKDIIYGGVGNDSIDGGNGADTVSYADVTTSVTVNLSAKSATGIDSGLDRLVYIENVVGGSGNDSLYGTSLANVLNGGKGADTLSGGAGNDVYYVDNAGDAVVEAAASGIDTVMSSISFSFYVSGRSNLEKLTLTGKANINATGNALDNVLNGNSGNNALNGSTGNDTLIGGAGIDVMNGGGGADLFDFNALAESGKTVATADKITGFAHLVDKIDLATLDADAALAGNQAFTFIGKSNFHHVAGELRYSQGKGHTYVMADTDGNGVADFLIDLIGTITLTEGDFVL